MNNTILLKTGILTLCLCFTILTLAGCSQPVIEGYSSDPSKREDKLPAHPVKIEVQIQTSFGEPLHHIKAKAKTSQGSESNRTNHLGRTTFDISRTGGEPIIIEFKIKGRMHREKIRHLPTKLSRVGLNFEMTSPDQIRFVNYTIQGLHR